jgi:hypothetical protein
MQIINTTPTSKAMLTNKIITSRNSKALLITSNTSTRRRSSTSSRGSYQKKKIIRPDSPKEERDELVFNIVYNASQTDTMMITPPPSPKSAPLISACFEANDRILTAKRNGQLKCVMNEYIALQKEGLLFTDHTYNLILDSYASLRSNGTPLTPMMKSKFLFYLCL